MYSEIRYCTRVLKDTLENSAHKRDSSASVLGLFYIYAHVQDNGAACCKKKKYIQSLREVALKQFVISGDLEQEFEAMTVCFFSEIFPLQVYFCYKADFFFSWKSPVKTVRHLCFFFFFLMNR